MKKLLLLILGCLTLLPGYSFYVNGIKYNITSDIERTVEVGGNSIAGDIIIPETVDYDGKTYTVTSIGYGAFYYCDYLTSVTIPNSVTSIGNRAFEGCWSLKSVTIPNSVTSIGEDAFYGCVGLTSVTIPNSVTSIGSEAFRSCSGLTSVTIPNSVTSIGSGAFQNCTKLTKVDISDLPAWCNINFGNEYANPLYYAKHLYLNNEEITELTIPDGVSTIKNYTFFNCTGLTCLTIPNSVTSIRDYAFSDCPFAEIELLSTTPPSFYDSTFNNTVFKEATLVIPDNTIYSYLDTNWRNFLKIEEENGAKAYMGNDNVFTYRFIESLHEAVIVQNVSYKSMTNVSIPDNVVCDLYGTEEFYKVTSIGVSAFQDCNLISSLKLPSELVSIGESAFSGCTGLTNIEIPNSVTSIGSSAFYNCSGLTSVTIGNSVISIGSYAFSGCSGLTNLEIPNSVTSIGGSAFYYSGLTSVTIGNSVISIGSYAFSGCSGLTNLEIPNSVTSIGHSAFRNCSGLTSVTIGNSVISIGSYAFSGCSGLKSVTIGNSVTSIGYDAFTGCPLAEIELLSTTPPSFYDSTFNNIVFEEATLVIPDNTIHSYLATNWNKFLKIEEENGAKAYIGNDNVFTYRFIESLHEAGIVQNDSYKNMTNVSIPDRVVCDLYGPEEFYKVTSIGFSAFLDCNLISSLKLPSGLIIIGESAFSGCTGLTSIEIPNSVTSIGYSAFRYCSSLKRVDISDLEAWCNIDFGNESGNPLAYAKHLYLNNEEITELTIPDGISTIKNYAFRYCTGLTSVTIPNSVTSIGSYAFSNCTGLTSVTIPNSVTSIGGSAFDYCSGLKRVYIPDLAAWCNIGFGDVYANPLYYAKHLYLNNEEITELTIPDGISTIKNYAFVYCSGLTSVTIPNSVTSIGDEAFRNCSRLTSMTFEDGMETLSFAGSNSFPISNLYLGRTLSIEYSLSFDKLNSLTVGGFVTQIPNKVFNNSSLTSVTINPGAQVVIKEGAFSGCSTLTDLVLPEDIAEIGDNAFNGTGLKNVTVPAGVIGNNAFANCNLDNILIGAKVESIGEMAFDGSNAIQNVYSTPTTPPAAQNNTFSYYEAQLWVPEEAIDTYYNFTRCWYRFSGKPLVCPENITLDSPEKFIGKPGETLQLTATITPANVTLDRVLWRSTNPAVATVDNNGLVTIHNFQPSEESLTRATEKGFCQIIASTLYEESPMAVVNIEAQGEDTSYIIYVNSDNMNADSSAAFDQNDVYTLQGVCVKRNASQSDIDALNPGIYIIGGKKVVVK